MSVCLSINSKVKIYTHRVPACLAKSEGVDLDCSQLFRVWLGEIMSMGKGVDACVFIS